MIGELEISRMWDAPIVTEVTPFKAFYPAEDDHQEYFRRCRVMIEQKLAKFRKQFLAKLKK